MNIFNISTGFSEIPGQISTNIFVQGCKIHCKDCQNPNLQPFDGGTEIKSTEIVNILKKYDMSNWICWLGGEPTDQPTEFQAFNKEIKENTNLKICLYTGRYFKDVEHLLDNVDLIIDGPWEGIGIKEENTNQKIYLKEINKWYNVIYKELKEKIKET